MLSGGLEASLLQILGRYPGCAMHVQYIPTIVICSVVPAQHNWRDVEVIGELKASTNNTK